LKIEVLEERLDCANVALALPFSAFKGSNCTRGGGGPRGKRRAEEALALITFSRTILEPNTSGLNASSPELSTTRRTVAALREGGRG
jgi:hypothetical protein